MSDHPDIKGPYELMIKDIELIKKKMDKVQGIEPVKKEGEDEAR